MSPKKNPAKRQKKLNVGHLESGSISGPHLRSNSGSSDVKEIVCGFCQSSKLSMATGPMLHYANGKPVQSSNIFDSNVIHVHKKCVDWAPRVYYAGENIINLEKELERSGQLECSGCRLKGAALGCYMKHCRKSFHVLCAMKILHCRWDFENFLMFCPSHSSLKFPSEKSQFGEKSSKNNSKSTQISFGASSQKGVTEWVLCGSALSTKEKFLLVKFGETICVSVSKYWNPNVTHVITATDVNGACCRTIKVLMAILHGGWILKIDWVKACMEALYLVDEEPYEVSLDNYGCRDGPKTGRLRSLDNAPKLFKDLIFYFIGDFVPTYKIDLVDLIRAAGGFVLACKNKLVAQVHDGRIAPSTALVVYNLEPPQGSMLREDDPVMLWKREAEVLAAMIGSHVISDRWILDSIAACRLQPFTL
ncbi:BRCA1-associated RING domain protein 1 [Vitis riparia]|uniref:BRCA1-associated RING domain protein 1 n=1 Tax=Vitis riparia TaxID=96939 RepID=UPI00155A440F|nr:BRCA1-associated RING domain protein 1 [Vitis riparia]